MKTAITLLFIIATSMYGQQPEMLSGTLQRADQLTAEEVKQLTDAQADITKAIVNLQRVQASVALAHKMTKQSWMEWSSWYEFDGDYILQRHRSYQGSVVSPLDEWRIK